MMKQLGIFFLLVIFLWCPSCKKGTNINQSGVADIPFQLYDLRGAADSLSTPVNYPSTFILKSDNSWTLDLQGAVSSGTYTWATTSIQHAAIKFSVLQWVPLVTDTALSFKLKSVIDSVDKCNYSLSTAPFLNFEDDSSTAYLRTNKK